MFQEICNLIEDLTGLTKGTDLQVGHRLPGAPDRCTLVGEAGGGESNFYCPDMMNLNIQVVTRAKTYFQARDDAWVVFSVLHGTVGWNMLNAGSGPDYLAMAIEAMTTPQYIGQDENGRFEFSCNYIWRVRQGSCIEP